MPFDPAKHHRRSIRLPEYDYSWPGGYFVTICAHHHRCLFGEIVEGAMRLNRAGEIASEYWEQLPRLYSHIILDEWVLMPNHFHGIIIINGCRGGSRTAPTVNLKPLGRLVGAYKTMSTRRMNELRRTPGSPIWQRNFYERVIRDTDELNAIREYIRLTPAMWDNDEENPARQSQGRRPS